jgi:predicted RNase H-like HicB family nuclease
MEEGKVAFTAVYLKSSYGYVGFLEELPGVNSSGRTLDEALIAGKDVVRESFVL